MGAAVEGVSCLEVFVAAGPPKLARTVNHQRVANATSKDGRTICASEQLARPGTLFRVRGHKDLDVANELGKEPNAICSGCPKSLRDCIAQKRFRR
jgi:hypothetical protein